MKLHYEVTFHTYIVSSLFSLAAVGRWNILALGNFSKEMESGKGKCESKKKKYSSFQKELGDLNGKIKLVEALKEEEKVHKSPSTLTV